MFLAALVHGTVVVGVSQTTALNKGRHLYLAGRPSRLAFAHILVISYFICNISVKKYQNPFMCVKVKKSQRQDDFWDTVYIHCYWEREIAGFNNDKHRSAMQVHDKMYWLLKSWNQALQTFNNNFALYKSICATVNDNIIVTFVSFNTSMKILPSTGKDLQPRITKNESFVICSSFVAAEHNTIFDSVEMPTKPNFKSFLLRFCSRISVSTRNFIVAIYKATQNKLMYSRQHIRHHKL